MSSGRLEADVPAAPICTVDEVVTDQHVSEAGLLRRISGPAGRLFLVPRGAIAFRGALEASSREVPVLGG
jgi:crotonobetainyl-CoA:carnitine CoA-transferase CaiB-like acyl-CoA transferase